LLSEQESVRYNRQMIIPEWGQAGQLKLKDSKVVVAGAGGLGSAVLTYLAAAGVGTIRVVDADEVELSNLNRQILHSETDIGKKKVFSAKEHLESLNTGIRIEAISDTISEDNVFDLVEEYPIVDALDNLPTRLLLNKVSLSRGLPLFHGAIYGLEGRATTLVPGQTPCLKCLYREVLGGNIPVVGVTPGVIGCIQATEVIKYLTGLGELLTNRLLIYDGLNLKFSEVYLKRDPNCDECAATR
jgi:molybdopterin/thiamine biosynthesis adenylyltransferase